MTWAKTYIDVSDWLYKSFLPNNQNEIFSKKLASTAVKFVQSYAERESNLSVDVQATFLKLFGDFVVYHLTSNQTRLANNLLELLIDDLPLTSSLIGYTLAETKDSPNKEFIDALVAKALTNDKTPGKYLFFNKIHITRISLNNTNYPSPTIYKKF